MTLDNIESFPKTTYILIIGKKYRPYEAMQMHHDTKYTLQYSRVNSRQKFTQTSETLLLDFQFKILV